MAGAKSSSHVPKFGNWDTDDVPYTICFENASELRAAGITFDPNDPDTYPPEIFAPAPSAAANHKSTPADRRRHRGQAATHDGGKHQQQRRTREGGAIASFGSEKLNSERSSSDNALLKERKQSRRKKSNENGVEGIGRSAPAVGGNPNPNPKSRRINEGEMMASVPKFGSWEARDPKSGDGYTTVFNKVKIEKQIAASKPKAVPPLMNQTKQPIARTTTTTTTSTTHGSTSLASKICCCLCPK